MPVNQFRTCTELPYCIALYDEYSFRTKLIKASPKLIPEAVENAKKPTIETHDQVDLRDRILSKVCSNGTQGGMILAYISRCQHLTLHQTCVQLRLSLKEEDVDLLEELFVQEGIIFDPSSVADFDLACQDTASEEISLLMQAVEELKETVEEVTSRRPHLHTHKSILSSCPPCHKIQAARTPVF